MILRERLGANLSDSDVARLAGEKEALYRSLYGPHVSLLPGAAEFLRKARGRGFGTALATAAPAENVQFILERTELGTTFDAVVTADDGFPGKPAPDIFLAAAIRLDTLPGQSLVFEDALNGVEAARSAGMRVVVLSTSLAPQEIPRGQDILAVAADYRTLDLDALTLTSDL
jgi:HAD superfamily hydrolase (TIGR01509 family)